MEQLPSNAWGVLNQFSTSLTGVSVFSDQLIEGVQEGTINPIELRVFIKSLEMILERVNKETQKNQLNAADFYPEKTFKAFGAEITKGATFTSYDYSGCNDKEWDRWNKEKEIVSEKVKKREIFLRSMTKPESVFDEDTGETWTINPPVKKETLGLKVSIK